MLLTTPDGMRILDATTLHAYKDVSDAFAYYLENENDGRPIILAGFSQGADMVYRLMEEYFHEEIKWWQPPIGCLTEDMGRDPQIPAPMICTFVAEATIINPAATRINPLTRQPPRTPWGGGAPGPVRFCLRGLTFTITSSSLRTFRRM